MKRMLALLLSLTLVLALAACGGNTSGKNTSGQTGSSTPLRQFRRQGRRLRLLSELQA